MSSEIVLHPKKTSHDLNNIVEDFFPEFCNPTKKPAILAPQWQ